MNFNTFMDCRGRKCGGPKKSLEIETGSGSGEPHKFYFYIPLQYTTGHKES
jgi:hypothetical protein